MEQEQTIVTPPVSPYSCSSDLYSGTGWITTATGGKFDPLKPVFSLKDIAHALGMNCRFNGHVSEFYSVAEHSVIVARLMKDHVGGDPMEGLLHDGTEAYLSDVPAPFKQFLPDFVDFDKRVDRALRAAFGIPLKCTAECKKADWLALFIEAYYLTPNQGEEFDDTYGLREEALELREDFRPVPLTPVEATSFFMSYAKILQ